MYLNELDSRSWSLKDALSKYTIEYGDKARSKLQRHLMEYMNDINVKKQCQKDSFRMLERLNPDFKKSKTSHQQPQKLDPSGPSVITDQPQQPQNIVTSSSAGPSIINGQLQMRDNIGTIHMNNNASEHVNKKRKNIDDINPPKDEIDMLFNRSQEVQSDDEEDAPIFLTLQKAIKVKYPVNSWIKNGTNFTNLFIKYQKSCIEMANNSGFILETNAHEVLMLSSILLVRPHQHSNHMLEYFSKKDLKELRDYVLSDACSKDHLSIEFEQTASIKISTIIKELKKNRITREDAVAQLNDLKTELGSDECRIVNSMMCLIKKLPSIHIEEPIGEMELLCGYVDPLLYPLFNSDEKDTKLTWPNIVQKESNAASVNKSRRPDAVIRVIDQHYYAEPRGFGEVKTAERKTDHYDLVRDLVRCNIFSKEAIDLHKMKGNLFFQVVGSSISFNYFTLKSDGIYTAVEICCFNIPMSLEQLVMFPAHLDDLLCVVKAFESCCKLEVSEPEEAMRRSTLDSPTFHSYIDKKKSRYNFKSLLF